MNGSVSVNHTYSSLGTFTVAVRLFDDEGDFDQASGTIDVVPEPSSFILAALGLVTLFAFTRRRNPGMCEKTPSG